LPYRAPVADLRFILDHVAGFDRVTATERFGSATPDLVEAVLTEAGRISSDVLAPLNRVGDAHPARLENGAMVTAPGFGEAYRQIAEGGWVGMAAGPEFGGMGLPISLALAVDDMMSGACLALQLNPLLSKGQIEALEHHASDAIKALYLPKLISGEWSGTMNLTEPQAGRMWARCGPRRCRMATGPMRSRAEDLHHLGRQRSGGECLPSGAGAPARWARGDQGHQPVHGAEVHPRCRRQAGGANACGWSAWNTSWASMAARPA
jgi:hypothetical protein